MNLQEERSILEGIKTAPHLFASLYDEHYHAIFGYIFRRLGDYHLSKDITSETFLKACQNIHRFEWRNIRFSAWLYKIAGNEVNLYFRNKKYKPSCLDDLKMQLPYDPGIETERAAIEKTSQEHKEFVTVQTELKNLDTKYQEVISLRYFEEKSIREIAEILDKNEGTVKSLLSRGLDKLRRRVEKSSG